jgi:uncharacterized metal-binding protein
MPSGKTHLKIETFLLVFWAATAGILIAKGDLSLRRAGLFLSGYVFSMLLLSPDLDLTVSSAAHRWGWLAWLWRPYALAFRHRRLSHHLLIGPLTRLGYVAVWTILLLVLFRGVTGVSGPAYRASWTDLAPLAGGVFFPNAEHVIVDQIWSRCRRARRWRRL